MKLQALLVALAFAPIALSQTDPSSLASIEGKTVAADGQALRKSTLTLRPLPGPPAGGRGNGAGAAVAGPLQMPTPYSSTSDAEGKFSFTGLEPGRYTLMADHTGYINTTYGMKRTAGGAMTGNSLITLTAGQHLTGATIEMTPQSTISGRVTDEDGDPLPRVNVRTVRRQFVNGQSRLMQNGNAQTDEKGEYRITGLTAGRYYVSFVPQRGPMTSTRRAGALPGEPELEYATTYYPGVADTSAATLMDIGNGQDRQGINLQMRKVPVYHVRGHIQGDLPPADVALPNVFSRLQISVAPAGGDAMGFANNMQMANADGSFDVAGLTPGTYTISALKAQGQLQILSTKIVQIGNRDLTDINLAVRQPMDITGSVRIVPENYVPPAPPQSGAAGGGTTLGGRGSAAPPRVGQVTLTAIDSMIGAAANAMVQADGSFTLKNVNPLRYRVMVQANQPGYLKSATYGGLDALVSGADMSSPGGRLEIVYSMSAAKIDGTVTTPDGQPAADTTVTIIPDPVQPERTNLYKQSRTGSTGAFTVQGVPPGKYRVYAWETVDLLAWQDPDFIKPYESLGTSITVQEDDHATVTVKQISDAQVADTNKRLGR